jgi:hypothetical protein
MDHEPDFDFLNGFSGAFVAVIEHFKVNQKTLVFLALGVKHRIG